MPRAHVTGATRAPPRHPPALDLQCPECTQEVRLQASALVEGATVRCVACGAEAALTREFDEINSKTRWILLDPQADYGEGPAA